MNAWHVVTEDLRTYRAGAAQPALAHSIETHLVACAECRRAFARSGDPAAAADSARRWEAVATTVDESTTSPLLRLGVATRPLAAALGVAVLLLAVLPLAVDALAGPERVATMLLAGAPLAPMLAVAFAYRREADPVGELSLAAPVAGIRLVAHRALLVSLAGVPLGVVAGLVTGLPAGVALAWLLPGLALSGCVLAAGTTRLDPALVAAVLGAAWALSVTLADRRGSGDVVVDLVAAAPTQLISLAAAAAAFTIAVARRDRLSYRSTL